MSSDALVLQPVSNNTKVWADPRNLFDPDVNPFPPIFPLGPILNRFHGLGVDIYPIPLYSATLPSVKTFMANRMLRDAFIAGHLHNVKALVEASSGNTLAALVLLAPFYGIKEVIGVVDRDVAPGKSEQVKVFGISQIVHPRKGETTIQTALRLGAEPGYLNLNQYANKSNWQAHFDYTGPHVWHQTGGKISLFCAAMGTTGTIVGASKFLRSKNRNIVVLGAACKPGKDNMVPGARSLDRILDCFEWKKWVNRVIEVDRDRSYQFSKDVGRMGNIVGPTSGLAFAAVDQFIDEAKADGRLDKFRNEDGRVVVGFACGDTALPYLDKYSTILTGDDLAPIEITETLK